MSLEKLNKAINEAKHVYEESKPALDCISFIESMYDFLLEEKDEVEDKFSAFPQFEFVAVGYVPSMQFRYGNKWVDFSVASDFPHFAGYGYDILDGEVSVNKTPVLYVFEGVSNLSIDEYNSKQAKVVRPKWVVFSKAKRKEQG